MATENLIDLKLLAKPPVLAGVEGWSNFRFLFENMMAAVHAEYRDEMDEASRQSRTIVDDPA